MFGTKLTMERSIDKIDSDIETLKKEVVENKTSGAAVKKAQREVIGLFKRLKRVTIINNYSGRIVPVINLILFAVIFYASSLVYEQMMPALEDIIVVIILFFWACFFLAKVFKGWVVQSKADIDAKFDEKEIEIKKESGAI